MVCVCCGFGAEASRWLLQKASGQNAFVGAWSRNGAISLHDVLPENLPVNWCSLCAQYLLFKGGGNCISMELLE